MLRNPYLNRSMIRSVGEFHGRRRELQRIMSRIGALTPQSVSLVGERRMGKSSLLWHLSQPEIYRDHLDDPDRYVFLFIDFQGQQHLDQSGFCQVFGHNLQHAAGDRLQVSMPAQLSELEGTAQELNRAGIHLVCLFDEFETVTRNAEFGSEFFGALRSLANSYNVAYITASRRRLQDLCHNQEISESPFFNIFSELRVGAMTEAEIRNLISQPSEAAGVALEATVDLITPLGGRLPFFTQIACSAAFECLTEADHRELVPERLERSFMEESSSHFRYLWESFDEDERGIALALAEGADATLDSSPAFRVLEEAGYVERGDGGPRLFSQPFAGFLLEQAADRSAVGSTPPKDERPKPASIAGLFLRPPWVYLWPLLLVVTVGLYLTVSLPTPIGLDEPAPERTVELKTLSGSYRSAAGAPAIEVGFHFRGKSGGEPSGALELSSATPHRESAVHLTAGDECRLAIKAEEDGFAYLYQATAQGVVQLPDPRSSTPLSLQRGRTEHMPKEPDRWLSLDATGVTEIPVVTSTARNRKLQGLYQQILQAPKGRREEYESRLLKLVRQMACAVVTVPIAADAAANAD